MKVMFSSTYVDLAAYREEVLRALQNFQVDLGAMEIFYSRPETTKEVSIAETLSSDIYIGVFAWRYGTVDSETQKSITQLEYETAYGKSVPCFIFLMDENYPVPPKSIDLIHTNKLRAFKALMMKNHTCTFFTTQKDLALKVVGSLGKHLSYYNPGIIKNGFWDKLNDLYLARELKDLAPKFNAALNDIELIFGLEGQLARLEKVLDYLNNSYDHLDQDTKSLLMKLGVGVEAYANLPYYENPFVNRDWEMRVLGLNNWMLETRGMLTQLKVKVLELLNVRCPNDEVLQTQLHQAKEELVKFISNSVLYD